MKKAKLIISIIIACILLLSVKSLAIETGVETEIYSARTYVDNPAEGQAPSVKGILEISGWYLSDDEQASASSMTGIIVIIIVVASILIYLFVRHKLQKNNDF